eukprot:CAMPEP_0119126300 /NCGR_PEP_ID=MMETSP1310-20130426/5283_1 /TAXON_ID=464262 /ORGANISM="Genus nov. species nov., Strain RCC2339" /LENGTH=384 /DNA_ID=CAMNT_0007116453 /DNA_START=80 /DNA_END=1230 /DNA_ORIENTATION=-
MGSLDISQVEKAATALCSHIEKVNREKRGGAEALLGDESYVMITVSFMKIPRNPTVKPRKISLPHAIYDELDDVCLITKDPKEHWKELVEAQNAHVKKVIDVTRLQKNYPSFEMKRQLRDSYSLFLADERVLPMLTKPLGKSFLQPGSRKIPVPIRLQNESKLAEQVKKVMGCTFFVVPKGPTCAIRVGKTSFSPQQIGENVQVVYDYLVGWLPSGVRGIQTMHLHSPGHVSLPVFQQLPHVKALQKLEQDGSEEEVTPEHGTGARPARAKKAQKEASDKPVGKTGKRASAKGVSKSPRALGRAPEKAPPAKAKTPRRAGKSSGQDSLAPASEKKKAVPKKRQTGESGSASATPVVKKGGKVTLKSGLKVMDEGSSGDGKKRKR